jgi:hypothetical protein
VIASNLPSILQKIEINHHPDCIKAFSNFLNDVEIEVVIVSLGNFSLVVKYLSDLQIKNLILPVMQLTVKRTEEKIRVEAGRNIFYLAQNLSKEDIKELLFPLLELLMADYIPQLKLALFEKMDILVNKVGIQDSEQIFLSIFERLEKDKDWHTRDKSLSTFERILNTSPEEYIIKKHNLEILQKNLNDPIFEIRKKTFDILEDLGSRVSRENFFSYIFPIVLSFKNHPKFFYRMNFLIGVKRLFNFLNNDFIKELAVVLFEMMSDYVSNIRLVSFLVLLKIYRDVKDDSILELIKKSAEILRSDKDEEIKRISSDLDFSNLEISSQRLIDLYE